MPKKTKYLDCCGCDDPTRVGGDDVVSVQCWQCTHKEVIRVEQRHLKPIAYNRSPDQITEALYNGKIRDMRVDLNYTQSEMAKQLGTSQPQYNRYERLVIPGSKTLKRIENYVKKQYDMYAAKTGQQL
ncbi:MAG: helix-turn-helix transcriptional regulator [Candidatus Peribacteraceae bacterium]|nr:helix-turn-helix transcriptional regulator [Candidatus Peribacteraceae bacterium]